MRWSFDQLASAAALATFGLLACLAWHRQLSSYRRCRARSQEAIALLDVVAEPAIALDRDGRVTLANPAAVRLLDSALYGSGERSLARLLCCTALHPWLAGIGAAGSTATETLEIELDGRPDDHRWYRVAAWAWSEPGAKQGPSQFRGTLLLLQDVSKQKTAQRRNAELVSGISHEMKTPLAGIKAYVELLADGDAEDSATQEEFLGVISSQADRLLQLVDNLVTLAEVEAATAGVGKRPWLLAGVLDEAVARVAPLAAAKQIAVGSDFDHPSFSVQADRRLLVQAAVQLLSNAVKYTPAGGRVVMRSRAVGDRVRVEIQDNGVGLNPEDCVKVFEKFYRVPQFKAMAPGTGLGLPLARHIVENLHGGTLTVESQPGQGSLFAVELSLVRQESKSFANEESTAHGQKSLAV
ncbi:MAG TPA: PAS domain-containing sensor histidine kinase [Pirellulales bacterium]|jgi:two-component system phosphate regulon sensor histidine kinase PhoR